MILQLLGAVDIVAAGFIYFGDMPGPQFIASLVALVMVVKGLISLLKLPLFYLPLLMNAVDVLALILIAFGDVPIDFLKPIIMIALFVKAVPAFFMEVMKFVG